MTASEKIPPRMIPAAMIIHQEGVIAVIALIGVWFRDSDLAVAFVPRGGLAPSIFFGVGTGLGCFLLLWLARTAGPLHHLESWQRRMVEGWTVSDALAVAVFSGLAEEALIRALLQPVIGLGPAAVVFAALHFVPDRKLWMWPVVALLLGLVLGGVFAKWGYPSAAAAHVVINGLSLVRFRAMEGS
jgi:membrane protease YdiL (CAAX protease family)